jgi:hypothetical protein
MQQPAVQLANLRVFRPKNPYVALGLAVNHLMTKPAFANLRFGDWSRILVVCGACLGYRSMARLARDSLADLAKADFFSGEPGPTWPRPTFSAASPLNRRRHSEDR